MLKNSIFPAVVCGLCLALAPALHAQKKGAAPAPQARTYNVVFDLGDASPYTGTMALTIAKETVTGTVKIVSPTPVTGEGDGTLKGDVLVLDFGYRMETENCGGRVHMEGKMTAKKDEASGTAKTDGGCSPDGQPAAGTFTLKTAPDTQ